MIGPEEEDRWEDEGGNLLDENGEPVDNEDDKLVILNHPADPVFIPWRRLWN